MKVEVLLFESEADIIYNYIVSSVVWPHNYVELQIILHNENYIHIL